MTKRIAFLALAGSVLIGSPAALSGQEAHAVERDELERTMVDSDRSADERRSAIRSVLDHEAVRRTAEEHGVDLVRAKDAVATLEGEALARVATQAERVDRALAGGDSTVVIGTTTLIIALLVLIIILVA